VIAAVQQPPVNKTLSWRHTEDNVATSIAHFVGLGRPLARRRTPRRRWQRPVVSSVRNECTVIVALREAAVCRDSGPAGRR